MTKSRSQPATQPLRGRLVLLAGSILGLTACGPEIVAASPATHAASGPSQEFPMKVRMDVDGQTVYGSLGDTAAARDFAALLPLSLTLEEYARIERIATLPRKLSVAGAPAGTTPKSGDITYYAPWGTLAIFVGDNVYARGLVRLGRVETGLTVLQRAGPLDVKIERDETTTAEPRTGAAIPGGGQQTGGGQQIARAGSQVSAQGPAEYFTGRVRVDPLWPADNGITASGSWVTFEPGARSAWHTHPAGQQLVVVSGVGLTQEWGKAVQEIRPGDVVWCPPGIKHWHGAAPTTAMTHLAVSGTLDGKAVEWMEKVSDAQYQAR